MAVAISATVLVTLVVTTDQLLATSRENQAITEASKLLLHLSDNYRQGLAVIPGTDVFSNGFGYHLEVSETVRTEAKCAEIRISWTLRGSFPPTPGDCDRSVSVYAIKATGVR